MARVLSNYAAAAKEIRVWLRGQNIRASVTSEGYSMGSSVNVEIYDQAPEVVERVEAFAKRYQYGHFNGMEDIYEYSNSRDDIPQAKFVFVRNELSAELRQEIWVFAVGYYNIEGAPADQANAGSFRVHNFNCWGSDLIYRLARGGFNQNEFWEMKAEQNKIAA